MSASDATAAEPVPRVLAELPMLALTPPDVRKLVAAAFEERAYSFGDTIVTEGEPADAFFVIASGSARVLKRGEDGEEVSVNVLQAGDSFGELALLEHSRRSATVRASGDVRALRLERAVFDALVRAHPEVRGHLRAQVERHRLRDFVKVFTPFGRLPAAAVAALIDRLEPLPAGAEELVLHEGDPPGPLFLVRDGRLRVHRDDTDLAYLRKGDFFGEASVLRDEPRSASITALEAADLLVLPAAAYRELLDAHEELRGMVERRIAAYEYRQAARVPLDFATELLPAAAAGTAPAAPAPVPSAPALAAPAPAVAPPPGAELAQEAPAAPVEGHPAHARRFPHVWQVDEMDCGAACLAMVTRHFGREVALSHIRRVVFTSVDGTSLAGIVQGAGALGLDAHAVKASKSRLDELPLPAICHWEGNHWVVLHAVDGNRVRVADPARGPRRLPRAEFEEKWSGYAALLSPTPRLAEAPEGRPSIGWIWRFIAAQRPALVVAVLLALGAAALQLVVPILAQVIVDDLVPDRERALLNVLAIGLLGALAVMTLVSLVQRFVLSRAAVRIDSASLDFLTERLLALPYSYFAARKTGDIERRLNGMREVRRVVVQSGVQVLSSVAQLVAVLALMFFYSWQLALVFTATAPLYALLMRYSARRLRPIYAELEQSLGEYHARQIDAVKGIETVKASSAEGTLRRHMLRRFDELGRRMFRADFNIMVFESAIQLVNFLGFVLFLWVGGHEVIAGDLSIGGLVAFNALVALANPPLLRVLTAWDELQVVKVLLTRLNDVVDQEPEQGRERERLIPVRTLSGRVSLRNLGFAYPGAVPAPILESLNLEVEPGTTVALVGRSGSGKTTLARLLAGLLEPTGGRLLYDGLDVTTLDYSMLRRQVGVVLQESYLFDDTIARNIAITDDEPDMDAVVWAARMAAAHPFVERLPLGYETRVGESGLQLSGGQRQRIAIARAIYHRPPVLVFDEATSALDAESERAVKDNIEELLRDRTAFVIAHRLSTVRDADLIVVLERGRIAERGTHDELMARQGLYYYLASQQLDF